MKKYPRNVLTDAVNEVIYIEHCSSMLFHHAEKCDTGVKRHYRV